MHQFERRAGMRRFTCLTNAFRKKLANHEASVARHSVYHNFVRPHKSLAAGVSDHVWTCEEIAALLD